MKKIIKISCNLSQSEIASVKRGYIFSSLSLCTCVYVYLNWVMMHII